MCFLRVRQMDIMNVFQIFTVQIYLQSNVKLICLMRPGLSAYLSIYLCIYLSLYLSIYLFIYLSVYLRRLEVAHRPNVNMSIELAKYLSNESSIYLNLLSTFVIRLKQNVYIFFSSSYLRIFEKLSSKQKKHGDHTCQQKNMRRVFSFSMLLNENGFAPSFIMLCKIVPIVTYVTFLPSFLLYLICSLIDELKSKINNLCLEKDVF